MSGEKTDIAHDKAMAIAAARGQRSFYYADEENKVWETVYTTNSDTGTSAFSIPTKIFEAKQPIRCIETTVWTEQQVVWIILLQL